LFGTSSGPLFKVKNGKRQLGKKAIARKVVRFMLSEVGLILLISGYIVGGAYLFQAIEGDAELTQLSNIRAIGEEIEVNKHTPIKYAHCLYLQMNRAYLRDQIVQITKSAMPRVPQRPGVNNSQVIATWAAKVDVVGNQTIPLYQALLVEYHENLVC
jgi:hypothetical protein